MRQQGPHEAARRTRLRLITLAILVALAVALLPGHGHAQGYTYAECDAIPAEELAAELESLVRTLLLEDRAHLAVANIVDRQWQAVGMGAALDHAVVASIDQMMVDEPYWERFWSGWSGEKAEAYATTVAERVFSSPDFLAKVDALSTAIAADVAVELEAMAARSASTSLLCLQAFVGAQYSASLLELFESEITADLDAIEFEGAQGTLALSQLDTHNRAAIGLGVIVASQVVRRISVALGNRIAGRVAGRVATRLLGRLGASFVPIAGWVIGGGLIVWDLYEGGKGALPQIRVAMQSDEVEAALRAEVAAAVEEGLEQEIEVIASDIVYELLTSWGSFCNSHPHLCTLPAENSDFKTILDATDVADLDQLSLLVDIYLSTLDRQALNRSFESGEFEALLQLPATAFAMLTDGQSPAVLLAWAALDRPQLDAVVESALYRIVAPETIADDRELSLLLSLDDADRVTIYLTLDGPIREAMRPLPAEKIGTLLDTQSQTDINWLFHHADAEALDFPILVTRINNGSVTIAQLRAEDSSSDHPLPAEINGSGGSDGDLVIQGAGPPATVNSVYVAILILSVFLAISTFALVAFYVVKHR